MAAGQRTGSLARAVGSAARSSFVRTVNAGAGGLEQAANTVTAPVRAVADTTAQFTAGLTNRQAPAPAPTLSLPRLRDTPMGLQATGPGGPARASAPRGGRGMAQANFDNTANNAPAAAPVAAAPAATPAPTTAADLGTFTGDQGYQTQGLLGPTAGPPKPTLRAPTTFNANDAVAPAVDAQRRTARLVRGDAAEYLNPASNQAEMLRRAENAAGSYFLKGRPGARNAIVAANLGQMGAGNAASSQFQRGAGGVIQAGAEGAVQQGLEAQESAARSILQREAIDGQRMLADQQISAAEREPKEVIGEDGVIRVRRGTEAAPVLDESGRPLRAPSTPVPGQLTPKDLLAAYTQEREAIAGSLGSPAEKAAALQALDTNPLFRPLIGGDQSQPPDLESFLTAARAANPRVIDTELVKYFDQRYGSRGANR